MHPENTDDSTKSWTDDLPKCKSTGAGFAINRCYRDAKLKEEPQIFRDRNFFCRVDEETYLYAIFSGHNGTKVADFAMQRMPAEILLGQLNGKKSDNEIKEVLRQAFITVEKCYQDSSDGLLAKKAMLQYEIPEGLNHYEITQNYQHIISKIEEINTELSIGACVVLCLVHNKKLYICNVGTCRALLCKNDENNASRVIQFSVDHNLNNEDEVLRLNQLNLNIEQLRTAPIYSTRCLGCYNMKGGFKSCNFLSQATAEPIISHPEIVGGIPIDDSFQFLLLMSSGMCMSLEEIFSGDVLKENREIVRMATKEFQNQTTLINVAQSIVDNITETHYNVYMNENVENFTRSSVTSRGDITLLVRNFNALMPNAINRRNLHGIKASYVENEIYINTSTTLGSQNSNTTVESTSSDTDNEQHIFTDNRKILPYVDFSLYYKNVETARSKENLPEGIEFY